MNRTPLYQEALRPRFHFTARYWHDYRLNPGWHQEGWINDVNGLCQLDGEYHLFAQRWWSCWLHAVSTDLVHWEELPPAFGKDGEFGGTQSGGAIVDHENTSGLATGTTPVIVAFWSSTDNLRQCISYSNDRGRTWTKYESNPVLTHPCRDPRVFWHAPTERWIMVLDGPQEDDTHYYTLFSSSNLLDWKWLQSIPDMYECPDMFELPVEGDDSDRRWVIVNGDGDYVVGAFDGCMFTPEAEKQKGDHGSHFYATMTWGDFPDEPWRRVQIAWMRCFDMKLDMPFNQQLSFPCDLTLRRTEKGIRLCRYPIPEIEKLYSRTHTHESIVARDTSSFDELRDGALDVELVIDRGKSTCSRFDLVVNGHPLTVDPAGQSVNAQGCRAAWESLRHTLQLRVLADRISIETFVDGGLLSFTNIVDPLEPTHPLELRVDAGELHIEMLRIHELKSMWANTPSV